MTREKPASPAWRIYYAAHPEVAASWGEANGREPTCRCPACLAGRGEVTCPSSGERWASTPGGYLARCPSCGRYARLLVDREPGRARVGGGFLGHVPTHTVPASSVPDGDVPLRLEWRGVEDVIKEL